MGQNGPIDRKKGKPSVKQQLGIQAAIRPYFEKNCSANYTAQKTKHNRKTVQNYFKEWTEALASDSTFLAQQHEAKDRLVLALDQRIIDYNEQIDRVKKQIKIKSTIANETLLANLTRNLSSLLLDKAGVLITPTVDIQIAQILKEKHGIDLDMIKEQMKSGHSS